MQAILSIQNRLASSGDRARVYELPAGQIVALVGGRLSAENRIAMRMAPEAGNDVAMSSRLRRRVLEDPAEFSRRAGCKLLGQRDRMPHMRQLLGVCEGKEEERLLPRTLQRRVVTAL